MNFNSIYNELKKYPFIEKMQICQHHSTKIMEINKLNIINDDESKIYPWEIEIFAELSILAESNNPTKTFNLEGYGNFIKIINSIRNYIHPYLKQKQGSSNYAYDFFMVTGMLQFKIQSNIYCRLFRYDYFFKFKNENINMNNIFSSSFNNINYNDFIELAVLIYFFTSLPNNTNEIYQYIALRRLHIINTLKIKREDYIEKQNEKNRNNIDNCYYGFNYLSCYPMPPHIY